MNRQFPLFQSHLDLAHSLWARVVTPASLVIDATCGNGLDAEFLALLKPAHLICLDIQEKAIEGTKAKLAEIETKISFYRQCHSRFPSTDKSPVLIVYNLGYLPGKDKTFTTKCETTLASLNQAIELIAPGGLISITCYPGHKEGALEEKAILEWSSKLDPAIWCSCLHSFTNRKKSPSLILIQKNKH